MPGPYNGARVAVDEETWRAFRQAALARGIPVSVYLGKLVEREVARRRGSSVPGADTSAPEPDQALAALEAVRVSIEELDDIAGGSLAQPWRTAACGPTSARASD